MRRGTILNILFAVAASIFMTFVILAILSARAESSVSSRSLSRTDISMTPRLATLESCVLANSPDVCC